MMTSPAAWRPKPARGYSWPPVDPGNKVGVGNGNAVRHGAMAELVIAPLAADLTAWLLGVRPDLADQRHAPAVSAWARAESRILLAESDLVKNGLTNADGEERPLAKRIGAWEKVAADLRGQLSIGPKAEAELRKGQAEALSASVDLDKSREAG